MKKVKTLEEKVQNANPEFFSEVQGLSVEQLDKRLNDLAKGAEANQEAKATDEGLEQARAEAKELAAPYNDAAKAIKLKMKYLVHRIKELGGQ